MGGFTDFLEKYNAPIQGLFETGSDIKTTNNLSDYMKDLEGIKAEHDRLQKFNDITYKLSKIDTNLLPRTKKVPVETLANHDTYPDKFANTTLGKEYKTYLENNSKKDENGNLIPDNSVKDIQTFLNEHPDADKLKEELAGQNFIQRTEKDAPMTSDELIQSKYKTAGLNPEDAQWYEQQMKAKKDNDVNNYNQKLMRMVAERLPGLVSKGKLKNTYADMFGNMAGTYLLNPPTQTETKTKKLDDYNSSDIQKFTADQLLSNFNVTDVYKHIHDYPENVREEIYKKFPNWKDETSISLGKYGKSDWDNLEKNPQLLDKISQDDWYNNYRILPDFAKAYVDKNFPKIAEDYAKQDAESTSKSGRHLSRKGSFDLPNIKTGLAFENVYKYVTQGGDKPSELKGWNKKGISKLKELILARKDDADAKKNFSKIWDEAGQYNETESEDIKKTGADILGWNTYGGIKKKPKESPFFDKNVRKEYTQVDKNYNKAFDNVQKAISEIIKAYGRDNLTEAEWVQQLKQYNWDKYELGILKNEFKNW